MWGTYKCLFCNTLDIHTPHPKLPYPTYLCVYSKSAITIVQATHNHVLRSKTQPNQCSESPKDSSPSRGPRCGSCLSHMLKLASFHWRSNSMVAKLTVFGKVFHGAKMSESKHSSCCASLPWQRTPLTVRNGDPSSSFPTVHLSSCWTPKVSFLGTLVRDSWSKQTCTLLRTHKTLCERS